MSEQKNFEELYGACHEQGGMSQYAWEDDPKRLAFTLARYKHTAKLLEGYGRVLEVGCADGFGSRIVRQHCLALTGIDSDRKSIDEAKAQASKKWPVEFRHMDFMSSSATALLAMMRFDAAYALDVLEHVPTNIEHEFLSRLRWIVAPGGPVIIGCPSLESQQYASKLSKEGHVNCKTGDQLRHTLKKHWSNVFLFSLNDETLGTGFAPMAQYRLALCLG